jgi:hypothetical protein
MSVTPSDIPECVYDARQVAKQRQNDIDPEMLTDPACEKHRDWRKKERDDENKKFHLGASFDIFD